MAEPHATTSGSLSVGDRVRYKRWVGTVYKVQSDGRLLIDFTLCPDPIPFFHGPYGPEEVTDA
jgi:hypothetical protein